MYCDDPLRIYVLACNHGGIHGHQGAQPMGWRRAKTSLQNDALVIYTTYLALDAPRGHKLLHDMAMRCVVGPASTCSVAISTQAIHGCSPHESTECSEGICDSAMLHQRIDRLRWAVEDNICQPGMHICCYATVIYGCPYEGVAICSIRGAGRIMLQPIAAAVLHGA